jgi:hypothetical protein
MQWVMHAFKNIFADFHFLLHFLASGKTLKSLF